MCVCVFLPVYIFTYILSDIVSDVIGSKVNQHVSDLFRLKDIEIYYPNKSAKLCALTVIAYIISKDVKIWTDGQKSL